MKSNKSNLTKALLILVALATLLTSAIGVSAETQPLLEDGVAQSGTLVGGEAGSYDYYQVVYSGDDVDMTITATFGLQDASYADYYGFNVYGSYDYTGKGYPEADGAGYEFWYRGEDARTFTIEVFNFAPKGTSYGIVADGIADVAVEEVAEPVAEAIEPEALTSAVASTLIGNTGGAYAQHALPAASDGDDICVTMSFSPADPSFVGAMGFEIWAPNGDHVASGMAPSADSFGQLWVTFAPDQTGNYAVQVYNYTDGVAMNYALTVAEIVSE